MANKEQLRANLLARDDIISIDPVSSWGQPVDYVDQGGPNEVATYDVKYMGDDRIPRTGQVVVTDDGGPAEKATPQRDLDAKTFHQDCIDYLNARGTGNADGDYFGYILVESHEATKIAKAHYLKIETGGKNVIEVWDLRENPSGTKQANTHIQEIRRQESAV